MFNHQCDFVHWPMLTEGLSVKCNLNGWSCELAWIVTTIFLCRIYTNCSIMILLTKVISPGPLNLVVVAGVGGRERGREGGNCAFKDLYTKAVN